MRKKHDHDLGWFIAAWTLSILLVLAFYGTVIWAIVTLVNYITAG